MKHIRLSLEIKHHSGRGQIFAIPITGLPGQHTNHKTVAIPELYLYTGDTLQYASLYNNFYSAVSYMDPKINTHLENKRFVVQSRY